MTKQRIATAGPTPAEVKRLRVRLRETETLLKVAYSRLDEIYVVEAIDDSVVQAFEDVAQQIYWTIGNVKRLRAGLKKS